MGLEKFLISFVLSVFYVTSRLDDDLKSLLLLIFPGLNSKKSQGYKRKRRTGHLQRLGLHNGDCYESIPYYTDYTAELNE